MWNTPKDSALQLYFDDIVACKPLSHERETELAACIEEGDLLARNELVQANLRFVLEIAKNYQYRGLSLSDLVSAGNVGLLTAAERFDGTRGNRFTSYAVWWIRQAILQAIAEHARTVRLPVNRLHRIRDISRTSQRLLQNGGAKPGVEEIATELGLSAREVGDAVLDAHAVLSLDACGNEEDESSLQSVLVDAAQHPADVLFQHHSLKNMLQNVLGELDRRQAYIVRLYFGLDGEKTHSLGEIGRLTNLTCERVRQLKERALKQLRKTIRLKFGHQISAIL